MKNLYEKYIFRVINKKKIVNGNNVMEIIA